MRTSLLIILLVLSLYGWGQRQSDLQIFLPVKNAESIAQCLNVQINSFSERQNLKFEIKLSNSNREEVFNASIFPISMLAGVNFITRETFLYRYNPQIKTGSITMLLEKGYYSLYVQLVDAGGVVLSKSEKQVEVLPSKEKKNRFIVPGLYGVVSNQLATRQGTNSEVPPNYLRVDLRPQLSLATIPFRAQLLYTTEDNNRRQPMNQINIQYNYMEFRQQLVALLTEKLKLQELEKAKSIEDGIQSLKDLEHVNEMLQKNQWDNLSVLTEIKSLESVSQDSSLSGIKNSGLKAFELARKSAAAPVDLKIKLLRAELTSLEKLPEADSVFNQKIEARKDSIRSDLQTCYKKRDSLLNTVKIPEGINRSWLQAKNKLDSLNTRYPMRKKLEERKRQFDQLVEKKEQLEKWKEKAESSGLMDRIKNKNFSVPFDPASLRNPKQIKEQLDKFGLLNGKRKTFLDVRGLSFGNIFPSYSPLMLDGIQLLGGNVELNPGQFYLAACGGKSRRIATYPGIPSSGFDQLLYFVKTGIGKVENTHFYISGMKIDDNENLSYISDSVSKYPKANFILGSDAQISLFKGNFLLQGEGALSQYIKNKNAPTIDFGEYSTLIERIPAFLPPNVATNIDYAYSISLKLNLWKGRSRFGALRRYIGPGYYSIGTPFLRNDLNRTELSFTQDLFNNTFELSGFYRDETDNILQFKNFLTRTESIGATARLKSSSLPALSFTYAPSTQTNSFGEFAIHLLSGNISHAYRIKEIPLSSSLTFTEGINRSPFDTSGYKNRSFSLFQSIQLNTRTVISLTWTGNNLYVNGLNNRLSGISAGGNFAIKQWFSQTARIGLFGNSSSKNLSLSSNSIIRVNRFITLDLQLTRNMYSNQNNSESSFSEWLILTNLQFNF